MRDFILQDSLLKKKKKITFFFLHYPNTYKQEDKKIILKIEKSCILLHFQTGP